MNSAEQTSGARVPRASSTAARVPTQRQYETLRSLGSGNAGLSFGRRQTEALLRRGWVTAELREPYYQFVRITPDGLRALALAVEKFGLPELDAKQARATVRVCARCGSGRYGFKDIPAEAYIREGWH